MLSAAVDMLADAALYDSSTMSLACQCMLHVYMLQVHPPQIAMRDFEKVLLRARPTVSKSDLGIYEKFTSEFGEEG